MTPAVLILAATASTATVAVTSTVAPEGSAPLVRPEEARGLDDSGVEDVDVALLVPRLVLFPVEIALTAIYWPLEQLLTIVDEHHVFAEIEDFLYNDARTAGFLPTFMFFPGGGLSGGLKLFHESLFGYGERGSIGGRFGTSYGQSLEASYAADTFANSGLWMDLTARWENRPHLRFSGIGTDGGDEAYFSETRALARLRLGHAFGAPGAQTKVGGSVVYNRRRFNNAKHLVGDERSIEQVYDTTSLVGFARGTDIFELTADLVLDFRDRPGFTSSGFMFEGFVGGAPPQSAYRYVHHGAELTVFINLYHRTRVLVLRAGVEGVEADSDHIPFSDLPRLGGPRLLRGYELGSFRDEKAAFGTLEYRWPVHANVTAHAFADVGKVAPSYRRMVETEGWKLGAGGGFIVGSPNSISLVVDVAYGDAVQVYLAADVFNAFAGRTEEL